MKGAPSVGLPTGRALSSTVALAGGVRENGVINVIGTGFGVGTDVNAENTTLLTTCTHVVNEMLRIQHLREDEGKKEGLIDNHLRIGSFDTGGMSWKEVKIIRYDIAERRDEQDEEINLTENDDICIIGIPGIKIPKLNLFKGPNLHRLKGIPGRGVSYALGSEVMIIGFPVFFDLQEENVFMPYVLKTIISSSMAFSFEREGRKALSRRLVLGCIVGGGFSGSPVISIKEGSVVGMIDYTPNEKEVMDIKLKKPNLVEGDVDLRYPAGITFAIPSITIEEQLNVILNPEMNKTNHFK